ncbi:MAG: ribonuclease E/G [Azospirillaceae bacterium]
MSGPARIAVARQGTARLVAVLRGRHVTDLHAEPIDRPSRVGEILLGRITGRDAASGGAFVALGDGPAGFLPKGGGRPGETALVQMVEDARAEKGPVLTRDIALPGRMLVHVPASRGVAVSSSLSGEARARWRAILPAGWIVRRRAESVGRERVEAEAEALSALWRAIRDAADRAEAPARLRAAPGLVERVVEDNDPVEEILCEEAAEARRLTAWAKEAAPDLAESIRLDTVDLDSALGEALAPEVPLPGGGRLTIEPTRALVAIDVDTGGAQDKAAVDRAAVDAVARHLRLRALGGLIVVDFVTDPPEAAGRGGEGSRVADPVVDALIRATAEDPSPVRVARQRPFGLVALTRRRQGPGLAEVLGA